MSRSGISFLGNLVEALEVDTKSKRAIFLPNKEDQCSMGEWDGWINPVARFSSRKLMQSGKFLLGQGVYRTIGGEVPSSRVILRSLGLMVS